MLRFRHAPKNGLRALVDVTVQALLQMARTRNAVCSQKQESGLHPNYALVLLAQVQKMALLPHLLRDFLQHG